MPAGHFGRAFQPTPFDGTMVDPCGTISFPAPKVAMPPKINFNPGSRLGDIRIDRRFDPLPLPKSTSAASASLSSRPPVPVTSGSPPRNSLEDRALEISRWTAVNGGMVDREFIRTHSPNLRRLSSTELNLAIGALVTSLKTVSFDGVPQFAEGKMGEEAARRVLDNLPPLQADVLRQLRADYFNTRRSDYFHKLPEDLEFMLMRAGDAPGELRLSKECMKTAYSGAALLDSRAVEQRTRLIDEELDGPEFDRKLNACLGLTRFVPLTQPELAAPSPTSSTSAQPELAAPSPTSSTSSIGQSSADSEEPIDAEPNNRRALEPQVSRVQALASMLVNVNHTETSRRELLPKLEVASLDVPAWARIALAGQIALREPRLATVGGHPRRNKAFKSASRATFKRMADRMLDEWSTVSEDLEALVASSVASRESDGGRLIRQLTRLSLQIPPDTQLQKTLHVWAHTGRLSKSDGRLIVADMASTIAALRGQLADVVSMVSMKLDHEDVEDRKAMVFELADLFGRIDGSPRALALFKIRAFAKFPKGQVSLADFEDLAARLDESDPLRLEISVKHPLTDLMATIGDLDADAAGLLAIAQIDRMKQPEQRLQTLVKHMQALRDRSVKLRQSQLKAIAQVGMKAVWYEYRVEHAGFLTALKSAILHLRADDLGIPAAYDPEGSDSPDEEFDRFSLYSADPEDSNNPDFYDRWVEQVTKQNYLLLQMPPPPPSHPPPPPSLW